MQGEDRGRYGPGRRGEWAKHSTSKQNVYVYSLISLLVQQTLQFTPLVWELFFTRSHLLWGELSAFSAANAIRNFPIFRSTRYPSLLGEQRQYGMRSLPNTSTHDQQWESNPRPSDLEFLIHLATRPKVQ